MVNNMQTTRLRDTLTIKQAAGELSVSRCTVYRWVKRGWLSFVRLPNGTIRIHWDSVNKILTGHK